MIGYEEKTYWNIGDVGKYGTLYNSNAFDARLTLDSVYAYTLVIPEDKTVDFIAVNNMVGSILDSRGEKLNKMTRSSDGSFKIESVRKPRPRNE